MTHSAIEQPKGIVAIFVSDNKHVICTAADFDTSGYGGFTLKEAQKMRVEQELYREVVKSYCAPDFARAVGKYERENIIRELCSRFHCNIIFKEVGYEQY